MDKLNVLFVFLLHHNDIARASRLKFCKPKRIINRYIYLMLLNDLLFSNAFLSYNTRRAVIFFFMFLYRHGSF